jgi:hypothetical protein
LTPVVRYHADGGQLKFTITLLEGETKVAEGALTASISDPQSAAHQVSQKLADLAGAIH